MLSMQAGRGEIKIESNDRVITIVNAVIWFYYVELRL